MPESLSDFVPLFPSRSHSSWAAPFPVEEGGRQYVFFEEVPAGSPLQQGRICLMELDEEGLPAIVKPIIEQPCHLSYPFVFQWAEDWYLVLANRKDRAVDLYRSTRWPDQWRLERRLLHNVELVAPTLHYHGGYWWLFGGSVTKDKNHGSGGRPQQSLHLYYAKHLYSPQWQPHRCNPLPVGAGYPAGRLFTDGQGRLLRPAQRHLAQGGGGIVLNHITELSPDAYCEKPLRHFTPPKGQLAVRTFNCTDTAIWVDATLAG